tara:strand:- start:2530 stop:3129 length:600 start_codon:yes stop_codon:yes gene_type:complete
MKIINKKIDDLNFAEYNPRELTKQQFAELKESVQKFGLVDPIIINKNIERENVIIGGHQRVNICKDLGIQEVPCLELDLPIEKEKELNVRLNKNTGQWNFDLLANWFETDDLLDWGFKDFELGVHGKDKIDVDAEWVGMPEYDNNDMTAYKTLKVHFRNQKDIMLFAKLLNQKITSDTKFLWYPSLTKETFTDMDYVEK